MTPSSKTSPDANHEKGSKDRRRRARLDGKTPGWVIPDTGDFSDPWEVRVNDVSRHGVGFESSAELENGEIVRLRIGRGPIELAKRVRVTRCHPGQQGTYRIGGEFV